MITKIRYDLKDFVSQVVTLELGRIAQILLKLSIDMLIYCECTEWHDFLKMMIS